MLLHTDLAVHQGPYLVLQDITLKYQEQTVVEAISFEVSPGSVVSILGKSGCGKSTLFQSILGALIPHSGAMIKTVGSIAYMPQNDLLLPWRTVLENLLLPYELNKSTAHTGAQQSLQDARDECMQWLIKLGLEENHAKYPSQLSGGMKKRIALLRAFLTDSPLMLLDEPFSALDHFTKTDMQGFLSNLLESQHIATHLHPAGKTQKSLLMITHDINEAILLSDHVIVLGGSPTHIIKKMRIDLPRPRHAAMLLSAKGIEYQKILME